MDAACGNAGASWPPVFFRMQLEIVTFELELTELVLAHHLRILVISSKSIKVRITRFTDSNCNSCVAAHVQSVTKSVIRIP